MVRDRASSRRELREKQREKGEGEAYGKGPRGPEGVEKADCFS